MIFKERKKTEVIVSWLLLFAFLPIVGFVFYILIGSGLSIKNRKMLKQKNFYDDNYQAFYHGMKQIDEEIKKEKEFKIIHFNTVHSKSVATFNNKVEIFTDGADKIEQLLVDLQNAEHSINIEYYIFHDDFVGQEVMRILCEKARAGVKVRLIYDSVGCLRTKRKFFRQLEKAGGRVKEFFPPLFHLRLINLKMNYRNHRKIVVIDGKIGYTGGINIRADHLGFTKKVSPWRDTHLRIQGPAVHGLQNAFINFWQFCNKKNKPTKQYVEEGYFPEIEGQGDSVMQVLTSGPNEKEDNIKDAMIKMINSAEKEIFILTPYFIPDEIYINAVKQALASGVKVKIMFPRKPDKKLVYAVSMSYLREVIELGAEVYRYQGFIHSKALIIDGEVMLIGTANVDNRSFALNFEISTMVYDSKLTKKYLKQVHADLNNCTKLTKDFYKNKKLYNFWQVICRLFSPLL